MEKHCDRRLYNIAILDKLKEIVEKYPDLRLGQILIDSEVIQVINTSEGVKCQDPFYEEPNIIWERMKTNKFLSNNETSDRK